MKAHQVLIALILIATCSGAALASTITVHAGESFSVRADAGVYQSATEATADFSIPALNIGKFELRSFPQNTVFIESFTIDKPGTYPMTITLKVDKQIVKQERIDITVLGNPGTTNNPLVTIGTIPNSVPSDVRVIIAPIPDLTPGTTFVLPITIRGHGDYTLEIPKLSFAHYEAPSTITVDGETTVPALIHIESDAPPGLYAIPVSVAGQTTAARVRIIVYQEDALWRVFIILGIALIVIGIAVLFSIGMRRGPRNETPRPPRNPQSPQKRDDDKLITYY